MPMLVILPGLSSPAIPEYQPVYKLLSNTHHLIDIAKRRLFFIRVGQKMPV